MSVADWVGSRVATRIVLTQLGIAVLVAAIFGVFSGFRAGYSAFVGGGISALASLYMARSVFGRSRNAQPRQVLRAFYVGELIKIFVTVVMLLMAFRYLNISGLPLFSGYGAALLAYWFALLTTAWVPHT